MEEEGLEQRDELVEGQQLHLNNECERGHLARAQKARDGTADWQRLISKLQPTDPPPFAQRHNSRSRPPPTESRFLRAPKVLIPTPANAHSRSRALTDCRNHGCVFPLCRIRPLTTALRRASNECLHHSLCHRQWMLTACLLAPPKSKQQKMSLGDFLGDQCMPHLLNLPALRLKLTCRASSGLLGR